MAGGVSNPQLTLKQHQQLKLTSSSRYVTRYLRNESCRRNKVENISNHRNVYRNTSSSFIPVLFLVILLGIIFTSIGYELEDPRSPIRVIGPVFILSGFSLILVYKLIQSCIPLDNNDESRNCAMTYNAKTGVVSHHSPFDETIPQHIAESDFDDDPEGISDEEQDTTHTTLEIETISVGAKDLEIETPSVRAKDLEIETPSVRAKDLEIETPSVRAKDLEIETPSVRAKDLEIETPSVRAKDLEICKVSNTDCPFIDDHFETRIGVEEDE